MRIAIIGAGAVGSALGALLARSGQDATLIGRPAHVSAIRRNGLWVDGYVGEFTIQVAAAELEALPQIPVGFIRLIARLPIGLAARLLGSTARRFDTHSPLLGSTLQSIRRGRPTEIDYLNGEIVKLGQQVGVFTPLNAKVVDLVHRVEQTGQFFSADSIQQEMKGQD